MQFLLRYFSLNMFINSWKGKFTMCPTELIHPKHASLKDNILSCKRDSSVRTKKAEKLDSREIDEG